MEAPQGPEDAGPAFWEAPEDCICCGGIDYSQGYGPRTLVFCQTCQARGTHVECWQARSGQLISEAQLQSPAFQWFCSEASWRAPPPPPPHRRRRCRRSSAAIRAISRHGLPTPPWPALRRAARRSASAWWSWRACSSRWPSWIRAPAAAAISGALRRHGTAAGGLKRRGWRRCGAAPTTPESWRRCRDQGLRRCTQPTHSPLAPPPACHLTSSPVAAAWSWCGAGGSTRHSVRQIVHAHPCPAPCWHLQSRRSAELVRWSQHDRACQRGVGAALDIFRKAFGEGPAALRRSRRPEGSPRRAHAWLPVTPMPQRCPRDPASPLPAARARAAHPSTHPPCAPCSPAGHVQWPQPHRHGLPGLRDLG